MPEDLAASQLMRMRPAHDTPASMGGLRGQKPTHGPGSTDGAPVLARPRCQPCILKVAGSIPAGGAVFHALGVPPPMQTGLASFMNAETLE